MRISRDNCNRQDRRILECGAEMPIRRDCRKKMDVAVGRGGDENRNSELIGGIEVEISDCDEEHVRGWQGRVTDSGGNRWICV